MIRRTRPQPARTETPEPRSLGDQLRAQIHQLQQDGLERAQQLVVKARRISDLEAAARTDAARIVRLEGENASHKETISHLSAAAVQRQGRHAVALADRDAQHQSEVTRLHQIIADLGEAARMPGDDREPTEPLPLTVANDGTRVGPPLFDGVSMVWTGRAFEPAQEVTRQDVITNGGAYPAPGQDDLYMPGWQGRSSAGSSAPLVGEEL